MADIKVMINDDYYFILDKYNNHILYKLDTEINPKTGKEYSDKNFGHFSSLDALFRKLIRVEICDRYNERAITIQEYYKLFIDLWEEMKEKIETIYNWYLVIKKDRR